LSCYEVCLVCLSAFSTVPFSLPFDVKLPLDHSFYTWFVFSVLALPHPWRSGTGSWVCQVHLLQEVSSNLSHDTTQAKRKA